MKKSWKTISRNQFLKQSFFSLVGLGSFASAVNIFGRDSASIKYKTNDNLLRTISYNILACKGWSDNDNKFAERARKLEQIPRRLALELSLYEPDIVSFQESPAEDKVAEIADMLGMNYVYFPGGFPGSILTHYEIVNSENKPGRTNNSLEDLFTRHWGKAEIRLTNGASITVHSVHLWPFYKSEADTKIRLREISELHQSVKEDLDNNKTILLQGDLNLSPDTTEYKRMQQGKLVDTFAKVGTGNGGTVSAAEPDRRIDYVYAGNPLSENIVQSRPLFEGNFRTNLDDPRSFALSDHLPQLADFKV